MSSDCRRGALVANARSKLGSMSAHLRATRLGKTMGVGDERDVDDEASDDFECVPATSLRRALDPANTPNSSVSSSARHSLTIRNVTISNVADDDRFDTNESTRRPRIVDR